MQGVDQKRNILLFKSGVVKILDWEGLKKYPWCDYYTEASIKNSL